MIKRTLMRRNQELVDFAIDPMTGDASVIDASPEGEYLLSSVWPVFQGPDATPVGRDRALSLLVRKRAISPLRADKDDVIAAFGAKSAIDLVLGGHGLSLSDQFWYRAPGGTERWEDINFFDNPWSVDFGAALLKRDYAGLASCSLDTPDVTVPGRTIKAWERNDAGTFVIKESLRCDGADLRGAKLAADLCARLFDEGCYVPLELVERYGKLCSASPLMLASNEELADGNRLRAIAGMQVEPGMYDGDQLSAELLQSLVEAYAAVGVADASAHIARAACFMCLSFIVDFHSGNFGIIRKVGTDAWRPAPIYDYENPFGFACEDSMRRIVLKNPDLVKLFCARRFSFLDSSWDWSWYDPQALEGFEHRIVEVLETCADAISPGQAVLVANMFSAQRAYVNSIAAA